MAEGPHIVHGTVVAVNGRAVLIRGRSGAGKSSLALELMARGATLVADDRVILKRSGAALVAEAPDALRGLIEARGVGVLHADFVGSADLAVVVDMDQQETERVPPERAVEIGGVSLPLLHNVASRHFPAALIQYLRCVDRHGCRSSD